MKIRTSDIKHLIDLKNTYPDLNGCFNSGIQTFTHGKDEFIAKELPYDSLGARQFSKLNTELEQDFNTMGLGHLIPTFIGYFKVPKQDRHFAIMKKAPGETIETLIQRKAISKQEAKALYVNRIQPDVENIYLKSVDPTIATKQGYILEDASISNVLLDAKTDRLSYIDFDPIFIGIAPKIPLNQPVTERILKKHPGYNKSVKKWLQNRDPKVPTSIDTPVIPQTNFTLRTTLNQNTLNRIEACIQDSLQEIDDL
jgi:serine/threonine protein kinase